MYVLIIPTNLVCLLLATAIPYFTFNFNRSAWSIMCSWFKIIIFYTCNDKECTCIWCHDAAYTVHIDNTCAWGCVTYSGFGMQQLDSHSTVKQTACECLHVCTWLHQWLVAIMFTVFVSESAIFYCHGCTYIIWIITACLYSLFLYIYMHITDNIKE